MSEIIWGIVFGTLVVVSWVVGYAMAKDKYTTQLCLEIESASNEHEKYRKRMEETCKTQNTTIAKFVDERIALKKALIELQNELISMKREAVTLEKKSQENKTKKPQKTKKQSNG